MYLIVIKGVFSLERMYKRFIDGYDKKIRIKSGIVF